jgi:hypothetical protein
MVSFVLAGIVLAISFLTGGVAVVLPGLQLEKRTDDDKRNTEERIMFLNFIFIDFLTALRKVTQFSRSFIL